MVAKDHDQTATRIGMPMAEFIRAFDEEGPFELIDGERNSIMPNVAIHVVIIKKLLALLLVFEQTSGKIEVFPEQTFALIDSPDWVRGSRVPDLAVYSKERWQNYLAETPGWERKPILLVPDLCVEVVSPTDKYEAVEEKIRRYLADGVQAVWVILASTRTINIYRRGVNQITVLQIDNQIEDADLLPGFSVKVGAIFPE